MLKHLVERNLMDTGTWIALIGVFLAGGLSPGPSMMLVMTTSLRHGFGTAMIGATGVSTANLFWILLAASGTAALASQFPTAFFVVKLAGLAFVGWIAWNLAFKSSPISTTESSSPKHNFKLFVKGLGIHIANPQVLVFFGAILPQFVDTTKPVLDQVILIMVTITITEMSGLGFYALAAEAMSKKFRSKKFAETFNRCAAAIMLTSAGFAVYATS